LPDPGFFYLTNKLLFLYITFSYLHHNLHRAVKRAAESEPNPLSSIQQRRSSSFNSLLPEVNQDIVFEDVDIVTPGQKLLAHKLTITISAGKSLLVTGESKCLIHSFSTLNVIAIKSHSPPGVSTITIAV
jgi:ABC-type protease/lipase transport system fused ATPase/permease subunit